MSRKMAVYSLVIPIPSETRKFRISRLKRRGVSRGRAGEISYRGPGRAGKPGVP